MSAYFYRAAVQTGDLPTNFDCDLFAEFSVNSLQGSLIAAKAQRSPEPVNRFKKILFSVILR
jgi:TetR/AcrR family transcriptional repressor of nem operon